LKLIFVLFVYLQECPAGTYKNVTGSDIALCHRCPAQELPHRSVYIAVRGTFMLMVANLSYIIKREGNIFPFEKLSVLMDLHPFLLTFYILVVSYYLV
jgi:hypothetical protein